MLADRLSDLVNETLPKVARLKKQKITSVSNRRRDNMFKNSNGIREDDFFR